jgi:hypothetical protein
MAILIQPDGSNDEVVPEDGQRFRLDELQAHVGGYIENVRLPAETKVNGYTIKTMYVNEEGRLEHLEHNLNASMIADRHLVGNALVLFQGEQEEEDDE